MRVIAKARLRSFWERRPDARGALESWWAEATRADWRCPADIKQKYRSASIIPGNRVVFNICGNKYRLIVKIEYEKSIVYIRFIGTHESYDSIDAEDV